jgi:zinc transporter 7
MLSTFLQGVLGFICSAIIICFKKKSKFDFRPVI